MDGHLQKAIEELCPEVEAQVREEFFSRMDPEYFSLYPPEEIATHLRMLQQLNPDHRVECKVRPLENGQYDIAIIAYDYFSEFSILCGLLTSFGLDIQSGHVFTYSEERVGQRPSTRKRRSGSSKRKIVDLFHVRLLEGQKFGDSEQREFLEELRTLIHYLSFNKIQEVRAAVNRRVVEFLSRVKGGFVGRLEPIQVRFGNQISDKWTVMEIHAKDTPAFLYSFSNALSLRGIYIYKVRIENVGTEARDLFYLCDRQGQKIEGEREQDLLKIATVMIKQFTHFLTWAPDPARAIQYFDQLMDKMMEKDLPGPVLDFLRKRETLDLLARLFGTSEFLWEDFLRTQFENLLPVLQSLETTPLLQDQGQVRKQLREFVMRGKTLEDQKRRLNEFKDREMFRIDVKHLLEDPRNLTDFSLALTRLAEAVLDQAYESCHRFLVKQYGKPLLKSGSACPFTICGLGKFGGREMGYASDIEVLFVYGGPGRTQGKRPLENGDYFERLCQGITDFIETKREGIFQIDVRLRPHGKAGALACPMELLKSYYSVTGEAQPFERQALTKLRWVAGDETLGRQVEAHRDRFVYSGEAWDLETALHLRQRQTKELVKPGMINVKYSPGGVIDIEYAVQYLQIQFGRDHPQLRTTSTLEALEGLYRVGILSKNEHEDLRIAYLFLRALIDGLRIVRGNARDLILPDRDSQEFSFLARRLGYAGLNWREASRRLDEEIRHHMENAHRFFVKRFNPTGT